MLHRGKTRTLQWFMALIIDHFTVRLAEMQDKKIQNIHNHTHLTEEVAFYNS